MVCPNMENSAEDERKLAWPALLNARDLGGLPTKGGSTRFGSIIRSDRLQRLIDTGWRHTKASDG